MGLNGDLAQIARQEEALVFGRFTEDTAWALGGLLRGMAEENRWPVVIDIRRFGEPLFFAALPGAAPDNADWARRKGNVVRHFHRASYAVGLELQRKETTLAARNGLDPRDYAAHGGAFPVAVVGVGVIGSAAISGLPQRHDHEAVVRALCLSLGLPPEDYALPEPAGT